LSSDQSTSDREDDALDMLAEDVDRRAREAELPRRQLSHAALLTATSKVATFRDPVGHASQRELALKLKLVDRCGFFRERPFRGANVEIELDRGAVAFAPWKDSVGILVTD
jgi:hypothetical protein